jgi:hypothetical protein
MSHYAKSHKRFVGIGYKTIVITVDITPIATRGARLLLLLLLVTRGTRC